MMKVSHPIVFGHAVKIFYKDAFAKHGKLFEEIGVNPNNDGDSVKLFFPPMTVEQRQDIAKKAKSMTEDAKVAIRNIRQNSNNKIKKLHKDKLITEEWLTKHGFKYHGLVMDKPRIKDNQEYVWIDNRKVRAVTYLGTWSELKEVDAKIQIFE